MDKRSDLMKQFVVIGLGNFGVNVATALHKLGNQVLVLDESERKVEQIKDLVTQAIVADATDKKVLTEFVDKSIDAAIVCMRDNIEASVMITLYLKDLGVEKIVAKAINEDHGRILELVGATKIIYPEKDVAIELAETLTTPNLINWLPVEPDYKIFELKAPKEYVGKTLGELKLDDNYGVQVIAVKEGPKGPFHLIPGGSFTITENSSLAIIGKNEDIAKLKSNNKV